VLLAEDQHAVGEFGADGQYEAFSGAVRPRTARRDLGNLDAGIGQHGVERGRELPGTVTNQEPEPADLAGAKNAVASRDLHVLVHETAEPVASEGLDGRVGGRGSRPCGRVLIK
jgi:hypothetical protein